MPLSSTPDHSAAVLPARMPPPHPASVDQFVALTARAVQRLRVYPAGSPLAVEALEACQRALAALDCEQLQLRVTPRALLTDDRPVAPTPAIAELAERLHRAGVATLTLPRATPARELTCLCRELAAADGPAAGTSASSESLTDRLAASGVTAVQVALVVRPAILEVGAPPPVRLARLRDEQERTPLDGSGHLYPPDKGWIRMDPSLAAPDAITLGQLAELVADPLALARMLVALSGETASLDPADALATKFDEVAALFRSAEPAMAEALMARLARAVLALDTERRQQLLKNTVLPGLLEGRFDGALLRQFPDVELADALSLLLELQVTAPELLVTTLDKLALPAERRSRLEPVLAERVGARQAGVPAEATLPGQIEGYARGRIHVDLSRQKQFLDYASYELAVDAPTEAALAAARAHIRHTDPAEERARCVVHLIRLESNPETAGRLLAAAAGLLGDWRRTHTWNRLAEWVAALRALAAELRHDRSEIADRIDAVVLSCAADGRLVDELTHLTEAGPPASASAAAVVDAFGPSIAKLLVEGLACDDSSTRRRVVLGLMVHHARALAPGIVPLLPHPRALVTRSLVSVLGHAGPGWEAAIGRLVTHPEPLVAREALRALGQIGTRDALRRVSAALAMGGEVGRLAEDTFWRFPGSRAEASALLRTAGFAPAHAALARRLLERLAHEKHHDAPALAESLTRLRLRVWNLSQMRLGLAAARLRSRG